MPLGQRGGVWRPGYDVSMRVVFEDACDTRGLFLSSIVYELAPTPEDSTW